MSLKLQFTCYLILLLIYLKALGINLYGIWLILAHVAALIGNLAIPAIILFSISFIFVDILKRFIKREVKSNQTEIK